MKEKNSCPAKSLYKRIFIIAVLFSSFSFPDYSFAQVQQDTIFRRDSIEEVVITSKRNRDNSIITTQKMKRVPTLLGENDLLKYIATLPGVVSINALDPGVYVRGGNSFENAFMVNDVDVANPSHLTGIMSVFDSYVLNNSIFYKSGYPARYNSYLSSYINMLPLNGDTERVRGEFTLGFLSSAIKLQGPIYKENTFAFSARTSYLQHIASIYNKVNDGESMPSYGFSDITLSLNSKISRRWNLNIFGLFTNDKLDLNLVNHGIKHHLKWTTFSSNFKLRYSSSRGFFNITGGVNTTETSGQSGGHASVEIENDYTTLIGNLHYDGIITENFQYNVGTGVSSSKYKLDEQGNNDFDIYKAYAGIKLNFLKDFDLEAGINYQHYNGLTYSNDISPRAKLKYHWKEYNFWVDYAKTIQYTTTYPYFTLKSPVDMNYPLIKGFKPAMSHHISVGFDTDITEEFYLYAALFYKKMNHVKDFLSSVKTLKEDLDGLLTDGDGNAKGIELDAVYDNQVFYLRFTYTLSESVRKFKEINGGRKFHPPFDMKHNLFINTSFSLNEKWKLNAVWTYFSGGYATFPVSIAVAQDIIGEKKGFRFIPIYRDRYNFKIPDNHRLDVSLDYEKSRKKVDYRWSFGVYNLYNQQNPTFIYFKAEEKNNYYTDFVPYSKVLLPFIPYASLTISF